MLNLLSDFKCRCAKMISYLQNLWVKWNLLWILKVVYNQKEWKPIVLLWMGLFWEEAGPVWRSAHLGPDISDSTWPSPSLAQVCYQREGPSGGCGEEHVCGSGGAGRVKGPGLGSPAGPPSFFSPMEPLREGRKQCITGHGKMEWIN